MKNHLLICLFTIASVAVFGLRAQTTNSAPSGLSVTQSTALTVTTFTPATIYANPTQTASLTSAYFTPLLSATGVSLPGGAVTKSFTVVYFRDGSSRSVTTFCPSSALPTPPAAASTNSH